MEEYTRLQDEKALWHGRTFNWQIATYGKLKYCEDEDDCFTNFETEFPAIVFDDTLMSDATLSFEPMVSPLNENEINFRISFDKSDDEDYTVIFDKNSFSYKIIYVDNLKMDSKNDNDKVDMPSFPSPKPTISYFDDLDYFKDFEKEFPATIYNDALTSKLDSLTKPAVSPHHIDELNLKNDTSLSKYDEEEQSGVYFNDLFPLNIIYPDDLKSDKDNGDDEVNIIQSSRDFARLTEEMRQTLAGRLRMVYTGDDEHELMSDTKMGLDVADTLCFQLGRARRRMTWRQFILALGLHAIEEMAEDGPAPSYVYIRDPVRRLCHRMISCSISGRGQAPKKYLFRHAEGRKSGAKMSEGHFLGRLTDHFGLVNDEGLMGLSVIARVLLVAAAGAPKVVEGDPAVDEGVPAPVQAPQPPPAPVRTIA
ncbi:hypothetical protein Tco_0930821 [Tanacetum coccineum]